MIWIGILVGIIFGGVFKSFNAVLILAVIGGFAGYFFSRKNKQQDGRYTPSASDFSDVEELKKRVGDLQKQVQQMAQRLTALEQRLPAAAPGEVTDDELLRQALVLPPEHAEAADVAATAVSMPTLAPLDLMPQAAVTSNSTASIGAGIAPTVARTTVPAEAIPIATPSATLPVSLPAEVAAVKVSTAADQNDFAQEMLAAAQPQRSTPPHPPVEPTWLQDFVQRWVVGGNPLVKVGVLILFLGLAFLLRYVAEHTTVPIELRYVGVAATAIALLLFGWRWRRREDNYGVILQGAGIGVLYLTTLAAMKLHPLISMQAGFVILFLVAAFAALLAILQDALALAVAGTLAGFAAPVLASTGSAHHVAFFTYLSLINLGIVAIAWFKAWRILNLIGFACSFALGSAWAGKYYQPELFGTVQPFLLLLFVLYVLITFLFARRTLAQAPNIGEVTLGEQLRLSIPRVSYVDGTLAFGVPFATFGLQYLMVKQFEYGAAFSALGFGLVYILLAFALFRRSGMRYALLTETMIALAVVFGSLSIPLGLEQTWTSAAWAVEALGVYWIGARQDRMHARLFALLLLFGSACTFLWDLHVATAGAVLDGSLLGCAMLAISACWTYWLMRQVPSTNLHRYEQSLRPCLTAFAVMFVMLIPFLIFDMNWASTAVALLGAAAVFIALRIADRAIMYWACFYQALAGVLFMSTLRSAGGGSVLANGWTGLLATSLIGVSMLAGVWAMTRQSAGSNEGAKAEGADGVDAPRSFSGIASVGLLAGLAFVNLAPLFALPWRLAAMIWPITGIATLWWAVRMRHAGAITFALVLQAIAGCAYFGGRLTRTHVANEVDGLTPFLHSGFLGPLLIAVAAFICARLLQKKSVSGSASDNLLGWIALCWGGAWWSFAWADELLRVLSADAVSAGLIAAAVASAWLWSSTARRLDWPQLGVATLAYLPVLIVLAMTQQVWVDTHPLADWGALAWSLALLMHVLLLRRQVAWVSGKTLDFALPLAHTVGAWLFVVLAAIELRWQFAHWASADSAWPLLGWMIAPVTYLWCLTSVRMRSRWPLRDYHDAYLIASALPIAWYLLLWVWVSNFLSNGAATPLPYLPILNPLEIAHLAVLLGTMVWWWSLRTHAVFRNGWPLAIGIAGATAFAMLTGIVMRTCHHWADVAWNFSALSGSSVVQTSLSIVWSMLAIGLMIFGNRNRQRWIWIVGAGLIAVVVAKLFLVELAAKGGLARIVSFIVVGLLLLLVGYFAPLPPKKSNDGQVDEVAAT